MNRPERIVVVGNGIAGLTAADCLRAAGHDGDLTVVGAEKYAAYSRPALSKALLNDDSDLSSHELAPPTHQATELLGRNATGLDLERGYIALDDDDRIPYDALVIASGCRPRRLGAVDSGEFTLRTLDDAMVLRARLHQGMTVIVVGGGPLGMEIASGCVASGCHVTLVSDGPPLAPQLGTYLSGVFVAAAQAQGLRIVVANAIDVRTDLGGSRVDLADGTYLAADVVVTAIGDVPNVEWLSTTGLLRSGALEVDQRGLVRPGIVAAGDVATIPTANGMRRIPLWTSAIDQAKVAALALLRGREAPVLELRPYFWTEQFGLSLKAAGHIPFDGDPTWLEGAAADGAGLVQWKHADGTGAAAALNHRIAIPRLRRLCDLAA